MLNKSKLLTIIIGSIALFSLNIPANAAPKITNQSKVLINGIGSVQVGMTVAQASKAAGTKLVSSGSIEPQCSYYNLQNGTKDIAFMVTNGRIARVDVLKGRISTASGARIGDTEARIKALYAGQIQVSPHKYTNGHYLTFVPKDKSDKNFGLVFETDGKRVTQYRSGKQPELQFVEGCS
ncbi:hypothetical protein Cri9333_0161 [Crinalium epipsammum PCC 9333]|uniref:Uncharacterized protein n=1 Tax=Crinalium epipsammum PCC 9333 TaxID=1173022 RepID=K9VTA7_9CYAN|nr:hypothetical protein [Crinalium epipsammum]AFZ11161.1 hypothetical protein Cri9333_0161 [Crinalium epipsammum PCC 9333]